MLELYIKDGLSLDQIELWGIIITLAKGLQEWMWISFKHPLRCICGAFWILIGFYSLWSIFQQYQIQGLFVVISISIISNITAYIIGSYFCGPKICPTISPSKK